MYPVIILTLFFYALAGPSYWQEDSLNVFNQSVRLSVHLSATELQRITYKIARSTASTANVQHISKASALQSTRFQRVPDYDPLTMEN